MSRRSNFNHLVLPIVGSSSQTGWHKRIIRIAFLLYTYPGQRLFLVHFGIDIKPAGISNLERGRDVSVGRGRTSRMDVTISRECIIKFTLLVTATVPNHARLSPLIARSIPMPLLKIPTLQATHSSRSITDYRHHSFVVSNSC